MLGQVAATHLQALVGACSRVKASRTGLVCDQWGIGHAVGFDSRFATNRHRAFNEHSVACCCKNIGLRAEGIASRQLDTAFDK